MYSTPTDLGPNVASRCRHPKLIKYYADGHDVDEDMKTIVGCGGHWNMTDWPGIACRDQYSTPIDLGDAVASYVCMSIIYCILMGTIM